MKIKFLGDVPFASAPLRGDEVCTEEHCGRLAVYGVERAEGDTSYGCAGHAARDKEQGALDWIDGEIDRVGTWISQIKNTKKSVWAGAGDWKHFLILRDKVCDDSDMPYREQHACSLESLSAVLDVARKATQEKIDRLEKRLVEEDEIPA